MGEELGDSYKERENVQLDGIFALMWMGWYPNLERT